MAGDQHFKWPTIPICICNSALDQIQVLCAPNVKNTSKGLNLCEQILRSLRHVQKATAEPNLTNEDDNIIHVCGMNITLVIFVSDQSLFNKISDVRDISLLLSIFIQYCKTIPLKKPKHGELSNMKKNMSLS